MDTINRCMFSLRGIQKAYRRAGESVEIFDDMNIEILPGDFVAIMGPSGSGKTTLLNLLGGIDKPDKGEIWFSEQRIDTMSQDRLSGWRACNVAFIFQSYNLLPMLTGARNVELPLMLTSMSTAERRRRVATALHLVEMTAHAGRLPAQLSGGQQQRVAIARALVADASVLLCDEPTGNLDRKASDEIMETLVLLNTEFDKTVVLVTHDMEAARYAKRICQLDKGQFSVQKIGDDAKTLLRR